MRACVALQAVDSNTLRMLLRHVISVWVLKCPPGPARPLWVVPLCHGLLPHLSKRLSSSWQQLQQGSSAKGGAVAEEVGHACVHACVRVRGCALDAECVARGRVEELECACQGCSVWGSERREWAIRGHR